jgi:antitoxin (DNA-binding transcriptional repressor) of toxin-antitoxin stability system
MPEITVELEEAVERLSELADAVIQGQKVWITRGGVPIALATLEHMTGEEPPPGVKQVVVAALQAAVNHLRKRPQSQPWCMS